MWGSSRRVLALLVQVIDRVMLQNATTGGTVLRITQGDCLAVLATMAPQSVDAIVTDPPYGIGFMGKEWDASVPGVEWARECLRVLKPGGHVVAFAATRTQHRLAVALEDAHFEIRDVIHWHYFSGFPKSLNVSAAIDRAAGAQRAVIGPSPRHTGGKSWGPNIGSGDRFQAMLTAPATDAARKWDGWGTSLKPSVEPAILARKPLEGTVAANVLKWGTGALNIDACRIQPGDPAWPGPQESWDVPNPDAEGLHFKQQLKGTGEGRGITRSTLHPLGRWPANLYQCPKPSTAERELGTEGLNVTSAGQLTGRVEGSAGLQSPRAGAGRVSMGRRNIHPTVKPLHLMRWLVRLVCPSGGLVVDPFMGSGTTGMAAALEGMGFHGIERDAQYVQIASARLRHCAGAKEVQSPVAEIERPQVSIFDAIRASKGQP